MRIDGNNSIEASRLQRKKKKLVHFTKTDCLGNVSINKSLHEIKNRFSYCTSS